MYEITPTAGSQETPGCQVLRQARNLPDLFERAASIFLETSGAAYSLLYLAVSDEEAIELSYAGTPPARSPEISWQGSPNPTAHPWIRLEASEILLVEHQQRPYALVVLGPRQGPRSPADSLALRNLCQATGDMLAQGLLATRALAADFQEQRANRHHHQAKYLVQRLKQVSHDMRNQLVPMLYATEELQEILQAPDALKLIINLERQIRLADQFSKQSLSSVVPPSPLRQTDLVAVAQEVAEHWQSAFGRKQQTFTLQLPPHAVWVDGDPAQHHQVLGNLLSNAHKYTPRGGRIRLCLTLPGEQCILEVADSGRGIGPVVRRRLFEASVREDPSIDGHGIGLPHCRDILASLGGGITVSSQPGQGASFQVRLSARCAEARPLTC
jgi:signal transduction histidine kinase